MTPKRIEFRKKDDVYHVYVDGVDQHWTCGRVVVSCTATNPSTHAVHQITIVSREHPDFGLQSTLVFDGKKPKEDDWFSGVLEGGVESLEAGVQVSSTKHHFLVFDWPKSKERRFKDAGI